MKKENRDYGWEPKKAHNMAEGAGNMMSFQAFFISNIFILSWQLLVRIVKLLALFFDRKPKLFLTIFLGGGAYLVISHTNIGRDFWYDVEKTETYKSGKAFVKDLGIEQWGEDIGDKINFLSYKYDCDNDPDKYNCIDIAGRYERGFLGAEKDLEKAMFYFEKSCKKGGEYACKSAERIRRKIKREQMAK